MSFRSWVTLITFILLGLLVFFGWHEIAKAWNLLGTVNIWIWLIFIPAQLVSYFTTGEIMYSYLRSRGNLQTMSRLTMTRIALELNFVNHILPSGGAAGFSYLSWVLKRHDVSVGRSTMAQIVRFVMTFASFVVLLAISVTVLLFDHAINQAITIISLILVASIVGGTALIIYVVSSKRRLTIISSWLTRITNKLVRFVTGGKKRQVLRLATVENFFEELHLDYLEIRREKRILVRPFVWALVTNALDAMLLYVVFLALGHSVSPATLFISFGLSSFVSVLSVLPGGAGIYETVMIAFLASAGVSSEVAIAGTLLSRATLLTGTVVFGYVFYQLTINKYGRNTA